MSLWMDAKLLYFVSSDFVWFEKNWFWIFCVCWLALNTNPTISKARRNEHDIFIYITIVGSLFLGMMKQTVFLFTVFRMKFIIRVCKFS